MSKPNVQLEPLAAGHKPLVPFFPGDAFDYAIRTDANYYAVCDGQKYVGVVAVRLEKADTPELLVFINPTEHNKGYGTAAIKEMLRVAFTKMNVSEVYAICLRGRAAAHIVKGLGFRNYAHGDDSECFVISRTSWSNSALGQDGN